jgi:hypothetical protein
MEVHGPLQGCLGSSAIGGLRTSPDFGASQGLLVRSVWELCEWRFTDLSKFWCILRSPREVGSLFVSFSIAHHTWRCDVVKCRIVFQTRLWSTLHYEDHRTHLWPTGECEIKVARPIFHETSPPRPLRFQCCMYVGPRCNAVRNKSRFLRGGRVRHLQH